MINELRATLFRWYPVRWIVAIVFLTMGGCYRVMGRNYRAFENFCWVVRVSDTGWPRALARRIVFGMVERCRREAVNPVLADFRADRAARDVAALYAQSGLGPRDLFRDVMVLKAASPSAASMCSFDFFGHNSTYSTASQSSPSTCLLCSRGAPCGSSFG